VIGIVNKEITNPNGVFSGETRTIGVQKKSRTATLYIIKISGPMLSNETQISLPKDT
jgi:hypothetical protein